MSWGDCFAALPTQFQFSANPARLLKSLLSDSKLLTRFIFASFLPDRFYGDFGRYPGQQQFIRTWITSRGNRRVRCLDTACGTGEDSYALTQLLLEGGLSREQIEVEGWTVEPLEVWSATHRRFPHDSRRELLFREKTAELFTQGLPSNICFRAADITKVPLNFHFPKGEGFRTGRFDLILCNGLLGGPIIHQKQHVEKAVANLALLLAPGGLLLAANNFHGGWKQKCPQENMQAVFEQSGLNSFEAGEGIGGLNQLTKL